MKILGIIIFLHIFFQTSSQVEQIEIDGAIRISNSESSTPLPGTIRWTGSDFEGWNGVIWTSLTGGKKVGVVADVEGHTYRTITIGSQIWMAENLTTSRYNDNTIIDQLTNDLLWQGVTAGAWCNYENDISTASIYGKLYNQYAVFSGKLCPTGWRVPNETD